jgi:hypothetical protein
MLRPYKEQRSALLLKRFTHAQQRKQMPTRDATRQRHSHRVSLAIACAMPNAAIRLIKAEPPALIKGSGNPTVGIKPVAIPILTSD